MGLLLNFLDVIRHCSFVFKSSLSFRDTCWHPKRWNDTGSSICSKYHCRESQGVCDKLTMSWWLLKTIIRFLMLSCYLTRCLKRSTKNQRANTKQEEHNIYIPSVIINKKISRLPFQDGKCHFLTHDSSTYVTFIFSQNCGRRNALCLSSHSQIGFVWLVPGRCERSQELPPPLLCPNPRALPPWPTQGACFPATKTPAGCQVFP